MANQHNNGYKRKSRRPRTRLAPLASLRILEDKSTSLGRLIATDEVGFSRIVARMWAGPDAERYTHVVCASVDLLKAARAAVNVLRLTKRRSHASRNLETMLLAAIKKATPRAK